MPRSVIVLVFLLALSACGDGENTDQGPIPDGDLDHETMETAGGGDPDEDIAEIDDVESFDREELASEEEQAETEMMQESDEEEYLEQEAGYPPAILQFRFPLADDEGHYSEDFIFHVDQDPEDHEGLGSAICTTYDGRHFPYCYDGHKGTDYMLKGGFETMDMEIAFVYAAAAGTVLRVEDGNYDRCHTDHDNLGPGNISCDGHPIASNYIEIEHAHGITTRYHHLKKHSMSVEVGDVVECGQPIALVGSSGISVGPHLHFQVQDENGAIIDPFAGEFSQPESYWLLQDRGNGLPGESCDVP